MALPGILGTADRERHGAQQVRSAGKIGEGAFAQGQIERLGADIDAWLKTSVTP